MKVGVCVRAQQLIDHNLGIFGCFMVLWGHIFGSIDVKFGGFREFRGL